MTLLTRNLQKIEQIGFSANIAVCLQLQGPITVEAVSKCIKCMQAEHPYLRMGIEFTDAGVPTYKELEQPEVHLATSKACYSSWQAKLQVFANEMRDWGESTLFAELASTDNRHQLFITVNQAGIDGVAFLKLCDQLLTYLSQPKPVAPAVGRKFPNIFTNMDAWLPMAISKADKPVVPEKHMQPLAADQMQEVVEPCFAAVWSELDDQTTKALCQRCKENKVTLQAAVSAASMLAMAKMQAGLSPLPANMLVQAPINMRKQISPPLEPEDCACAVSYLWWCQELRGDEKLWDVVSKASKSIKTLKANKSGLAFWNMIEKEEWTPPYTVSASSWGVSPVKATYGSVQVLGQHLMVASYGLVNPSHAQTMTHAHTFDSRLCTTFAFTRPAVSQENGQDIAAWQQAVLKQLAAADTVDTTVSQVMQKMQH